MLSVGYSLAPFSSDFPTHPRSIWKSKQDELKGSHIMLTENFNEAKFIILLIRSWEKDRQMEKTIESLNLTDNSLRYS